MYHQLVSHLQGVRNRKAKIIFTASRMGIGYDLDGIEPTALI